MERQHHIWSCIFDGLSDLLSKLHEEFPGGLQGCAAVSITTFFMAKYMYNFICTSKTRRKIKARQAQAQANIDRIRRRLETCKETIDESITDLPFSELQAKLQSGYLKCRQVLLAYQSKALALHDKTNCVTEFLDDAEDRASRLDALEPKEMGLLHGIPISLKETVGVAGQDSTAGLSHYIGQVHEDYSITVKVLMKQGAIPFVRTNISQALMSYSCSNPIYGEACHPFKPDRTCGGSSGGEGALLGGNGSILGIGCDMGGSNRIPAHFCGVCGFKPTGHRMSNAGNLPFGHGIVLLREVYGPMGRDVDSLVAYFQAALKPEMFRLDPLLPHIPWKEEVFKTKRPLNIGFYICDGGIEPVPAVRRAVLMAKACLEKMGHKIVDFIPPDVVHGVTEFGIGALIADDGKTMDAVLKHDVVDPCIAGAIALDSLPYVIKKLISKMFFLHPVERSMLVPSQCGHVSKWWKKNEDREHFRRKFLSEMMKQGIDAILCPTFPVPAWPLRDDLHSFTCGTYTILYNTLDFPCGSVPVTRVNGEDIKNMATYPRRYMVDKYVHKISQGSEDLPISVQIASVPFQEEVVLRLMKDIEEGLKEV